MSILSGGDKRNTENIWNRLAGSGFRARQKLSPKDREYYYRKGKAVIREHARDFVLNRLAPAHPRNDTRQTPFRGHPVFTAQHATATCCRKCLAKWHGVEKGRPLDEQEVEYVVDLLLAWLARETNN